jgi:hypothetical protein
MRRMRQGVRRRDVAGYVSAGGGNRGRGGRDVASYVISTNYFAAGAGFGCLAMIESLILSYVPCGIIFFCTRSSLVR